MTRAELNQRFEHIYKKLNEEQKIAVSQIYGPVMVIAGPGTGKTQILAARIGKILLETDYLPENILCVTYTDSGRIAMRKRLQDMIGADAYRVNIHTFHSFCNEVIQENISFFNKPSMDPISDIERVELLKKLIDELPSENILKRPTGDVYYELKRLINLFSTMKNEGFSSQFIKNKVDEYIQELPQKQGFYYLKNSKGGKKGEPKQSKIDEEIKKVNLLKTAAEAFDQFQKLMLKNNRYDFDDMIAWVIEAFENNETILLDYQEKYQFILVDEYQDTSGSQNKILNLLTKDIELPNIFVVGDDDQSIYRFQGASLENLEAYIQKHEGQLTEVILKSNYRSTQAILDASRAVITNNHRRLNESNKHLIAANQQRISSNEKPLVHVYENSFQELVGLTMHVSNLVQEKQIAPEKIAIIFTENKVGTELIKFFKAKKIPYYTKTKENLFDIPLAKKILCILQYLAIESTVPYGGDELLFEILHFDTYQIPPFEIAKASVRVGDLRSEQKSSLRTYLQDWVNTVNPGLFDQKPHPGIIEVTSLLEKWIKDLFNSTLLNVVENVLSEGKFLEMALKDDDKIWHLEVLRSLMNFIKAELQRNPDHTLASLMKVVDIMKAENLNIALYRSYGTENGVNLLTAHGSKGLEFEYVFVMNCLSKKWDKQKAGSNKEYRFPDNIFRTMNVEKDDQEEKRRLFYVAMTRAEEHLTLSWSKKDDVEKEQEPSLFLSEINDKISLEIQPQSISMETMADFIHIHLLQDKQPVIQESEKEFIQSLLNRFEMNATALNNYLSCPLKFYYQNLIRVPSGRNEAMEFGSAVHYALEKLFDKMQKNDNRFPELDEFIQDFKWFMQRHRESFTPEAMKRKLDYGHTILTALYQKNIGSWNKIVSIEKFIRGVVIDGVPIKGKIDKIEFDGQHCQVIDYKTGKHENAKKKLRPPSDKDQLGGDYWRQGVFYKILIDGYKQKNWIALKTQFQFVEPNASGEYLVNDIIPTPEEVEMVKTQIKDTWLKIQQHDFYTGCGKKDCHWCNFVKENNQFVSLIKMTKIEEDQVEDEF